MPAPYSDNLYSDLGQDVSDDERDALSPTDGYFHASSSSDAAPASQWQPHPHPHPQRQHQRMSSNVPDVPNVLVEDPTLRGLGAADKAREAEEERLMNSATGQAAASSPYPPQLSTAAARAATAATSSSSSSHGGPASPSAAATPTSPPFAASHHHRRSVEEDEPLRFAGHSTRLPYLHTPAGRGETTNAASQPHRHNQLDAPPAYSPSPSSPPASGHPQQGYQTFASPPANAPVDIMGVPEEHQALLPRQPESMGGPPGGGPPPSRWRRLKESTGSPNLRKKIKTVLGVLVIISIISAILGAFGFSSSSHHKNTGIIDKDPVREPDMGGHSDLGWTPSSGCRNTPHAFSKTSISLRFGSNRKLDIRQEIEKTSDTHNWRQPRVFGQIILRPTGDDASEGSIELEVISNEEDLRVQLDSETYGDNQVFRMITPRAIQWPSSSGDGPCIQMRATVWVPRKAYLRAFTLSSVHLDVRVVDGLIMGVTDETKIDTVVGNFRTSLPKDVNEDVVPYTLESRKIRIETVSGNVEGWFPLYDLLQISSASGDITAQVAPKPADEKSPQSAVLDISSVSGDIKVTEPLAGALEAGKPGKKLPARDYITKLSTTSGKIQGEVATSSEGKFDSTSGNTVLKILPIFDKDIRKSGSKPQLSTSSMSGDWRLTVLEPLWTSTSGTRMYPPSQPSPDDNVILPPIDVPMPPSLHDDDDDDDEDDDDAPRKGIHEPLVIIHPDVKPAEHHHRPRGASHNADRTTATPALSFLRSKHDSVSGDLRLFYPASWEGRFLAQSISGNIRVGGDGIEIIRRDRSWAKLVEGKKGDGDSEIKMESMSGSVELVVGGKAP